MERNKYERNKPTLYSIITQFTVSHRKSIKNLQSSLVSAEKLKTESYSWLRKVTKTTLDSLSRQHHRNTRQIRFNSVSHSNCVYLYCVQVAAQVLS